MRSSKRDGDDRLQERQRQVPELPPSRRAVDGRRLVRLGRQAGEPCQHQEEDERRPLPDVGDDDRKHRQAGIAGPGLQRQAELEHDLVEHAELRLVDQLPGDRHGDRRQHHRQHQQGLQEIEPADMAVEQQGEPEAQQKLGADREECEDQRVPETDMELVVGEQPQEIVGAGELPGHVGVGADPRERRPRTCRSTERSSAPSSTNIAGASISTRKWRSNHRSKPDPERGLAETDHRTARRHAAVLTCPRVAASCQLRAARGATAGRGA